jgi:MerC mercury resistance protein
VNQSRPRVTLDGIGTVLSTTCAIHCLLTPLLVASASLGALGWLAGESTELTLLTLATGLAAIVLAWGWRTHHRRGPLGLFAVALAMIGVGRFLAPEAAETSMVVAGGLSIALAHVVNSRFCQSCPRCAMGDAAARSSGTTSAPTHPELWPATQPRPAP